MLVAVMLLTPWFCTVSVMAKVVPVTTVGAVVLMAAGTRSTPGASGVTLFDAADGTLLPALLCAVTVKV